ncbi:hypothetical protein Nepgr_013241 [Nepenthes gracilis]|uniref:Protein kinase domain-containing protein n=1 Tax=Nepenthes gracilis TaxID=150966 RepID=A0AAD3XP68_NEPGR|nr:hypothetical protein Nepgr_013241 [Nepenthes gracilis]
MEISTFPNRICFSLLFFLFNGFLSHGQQAYENNTQLNCADFTSATAGYLCNGPQKSCKAYVTFRSRHPYDNAVSIAYLLGSEASEIALVNNITDIDSIPSGKLIVAPVSCSCFGNVYQHDTLYTLKYHTDTYFNIANDTYQGLTTCQALIRQNPYKPENLSIGMEIMVPVRCACPSEKQSAQGFSFLLTYMVTWADDVSSISAFASSIGQVFGVDASSILEANELTSDLIYPFTPLLVPLKSESCTVQPGNFFCFCENGYLEDGRRGRICKPGSKGIPIKMLVLMGLGIGCGLLCIVLASYWLYRYLKNRKYLKQKERLFKQNGGLLLLEQLALTSGGSEKTKVFTAEELQRATDDYNPSRILGRGGYGTVYKGMLLNGSIVAVKRAKTVDRNEIEQFINEVVVLSQINHRNVVKLLGCCLETEVPLLVYEFIPNGTLSDHIHASSSESSLQWGDRLRIASEVAGSLAYMHSAASFPIFHRDIKSTNILLDEKYTAKVSDFGTSRIVPIDRTHLTTKVIGTFGYLDPEYFQSSQYTDKSDVYSFGVVLVELLTGQKPISFARAENNTNLATYFISLLEDDQLLKVLDPQVVREAKKDEILMISMLAKRCLDSNGRNRPSMKEVATELEGLRKTQLQFSQESKLQKHLSTDCENLE